MQLQAGVGTSRGKWSRFFSSQSIIPYPNVVIAIIYNAMESRTHHYDVYYFFDQTQ